CEQQNRWIVDLPQQLRITGVGDGNRDSPVFQHSLMLSDGIVKGASARDALRDRARCAGGFEFRAGGAKNGHWGPKPFYQPACYPGAQTRDEFKCQPVEFLLAADCVGLHSEREDLTTRM